MKSINDYKGGPSTLCTGCGHDSVTQHITKAFFEAGVDPSTVAKISGIGCSSKTTAYFMNTAHGFNSIHGRMASIATGAKLANRNLLMIGISGDGDTASIGLSGFIHLIRRNLPMIYIVENNGVYGLTKGQFSATADKDVPFKRANKQNQFQNLDVCQLAIDTGCEFVARSFSGDGKQLVPLIKAAIFHPGTAVIDVVSPCITYANHDGSTKSYDYVKEHNVRLQEFGLILEHSPITADYEEGESIEISLSDGARIRLRKPLPNELDIQSRRSALNALADAREQGQILTGLLYCSPRSEPLTEVLKLPKTPLRDLNREQLAPSSQAFEHILNHFR